MNKYWQMSDLLKKRVICSFAHFWWETWAIHSHRSLKKRDWANRSFFYKTYKKCTRNVPKNTILVKFFWSNCSFFVSERANERFAKKKLIHSFIVINLSESLTVALLSWTTWAIPSWSLFWHDEQPENSLIVAHLSWAIWANRSQSLIWSDRYERMSEFPTLHHLHVSDRWRNSLTLPVGTNDFKQCMSPGEMSNSRDYFVCAHDTVNKNYTYTTV